MSHLPVVPQSDLQRLLLEQALAFAQQLEQAASAAPDGAVLDRCEQATLAHGRQFLKDALAAALQQQIARGEKRGPAPAAALAVGPAVTKAPTRAA
jgi:hypothetical protein